MSRAPLRVAIVSPQTIVREGITAVLSRHPDRVEVVGSLVGPQHPDPDVILFDVIGLLDGSTEQLDYVVQMTASSVLAVSRDLRPDLVGLALASGADGFFSLGVGEQELLDAVESAGTGWQEGDPGSDPTVGSSRSAARAAQLGGDVGLTHREVEVLSLIAQGYDNQQIADHLFLGVNSVKSYIRSAYKRVGVTSRSQAVGWAVRHGFGTDARE